MTSDQKKRSKEHSVQKKWKQLLLEQLFVLLCFAVFFLIGATIAYISGCDPAWCYYIAVGTLHLAAALSAAYYAKREGKNGLLVGIKTTALSIIIIIIAASICSKFQPDFRLLISVVILFLSAALGGIIGVNMKSKPKLPKRKGSHK